MHLRVTLAALMEHFDAVLTLFSPWHASLKKTVPALWHALGGLPLSPPLAPFPFTPRPGPPPPPAEAGARGERPRPAPRMRSVPVTRRGRVLPAGPLTIERQRRQPRGAAGRDRSGGVASRRGALRHRYPHTGYRRPPGDSPASRQSFPAPSALGELRFGLPASLPPFYFIFSFRSLEAACPAVSGCN